MVNPHLVAVRRLVEEERLGATVTVVEGSDTGLKAVIDRVEGLVEGSLPAAIRDDVLADAVSLMDREQNRTLGYGELEVYIETVAPQPRLLIIGAVHIAQELCRIAHSLGFRVMVSDSRPFFTTPERFPEAEQVIVGWPDEVRDKLEIDRRTYVVMLSHDARFEDPMFPLLLGSDAKYIGVMGSRRTHRKRVERLKGAGFPDDQIDRIHGPVGLDIGAEQPGEVAISILAEMIQIRYGSGTGESLVGRKGRIHLQRTEDAGDL
ncbi:MAG: xanthine dehydrogenase [Acidimicrobiia bacterium]|nr:XdhC family protein [bacterium]MXZ06108.1 xanthine dehydrogenase [Acidimicrobiia bacterium]MYH54681.1 xanthine dehydrogenase [Acidimicrobiia bacterium]